MRDANLKKPQVKHALMLLAVGIIAVGILYEMRNVLIDWQNKGNAALKNLLVEEESYAKGSSNTPIREEQEQPENTYEQTEIKPLHVEVVAKSEEELAFSITLSDFIENYNGYYYQEYENTYLQPASSWRLQVGAWGMESTNKIDCYHFTEDSTIWSLPTIDVYVPAGDETIQEITLNFDDHSYNPAMYEKYEEMCFYTLKTFLPELSNEQLIRLYTTCNNMAYEHMLPHDQGYHKGAVPTALFYRDGIGVYPFFAAGECVHLCIRPVTSEVLKMYEREGAEIQAIQ